MREELGIDVEVGRLLWVAENMFTYDGTPCHELCLFYALSLADVDARSDTDGDIAGVDPHVPLIFRWAPLDGLAALPLQPAFLPERLRALPDRPVHILHADGPVG